VPAPQVLAKDVWGGKASNASLLLLPCGGSTYALRALCVWLWQYGE
jgi:hypothetical protein